MELCPFQINASSNSNFNETILMATVLLGW